MKSMFSLAIGLAAGRARQCLVPAALLAACLGAASPASAQAGSAASAAPKTAVTVTLSQWRVEADARGQEQFVVPARSRPGDVIEYRAVYANVSTKPVANLQAILPLPAGFEYLPRTSRPGVPAAEAAADDGNYAPEPLKHLVKGADGQTHEVDVPYAAYRSLRWRLPTLAAGKRLEVRARVRVRSGQAAIEAPGVGVKPDTR